MTTEEERKPEEEITEQELEDVAGGADAIQNVSGIQYPRGAVVQGPQPPGELQLYEDQTIFTGDGTTTPQSFQERLGDAPST